MKVSEARTLETLANLIGARLKGDPHCVINGIAPLERATKGDLSFLSNRNYKKFLANTQASAVIISPEDLEACTTHALICDNPRLSLAKVAKLYEPQQTVVQGIHPTAIVGQGCRISTTAAIGPYVVLGDGVEVGEAVIIGSGCSIGNQCQIGNRTALRSRVTLYDNVRLGEDCLIHSGAVIGSDGFGFAHHEGTWFKVPHIGGVQVGSQVEIGSNTTIDRGFLEDTIIGEGVIIDNLVQIGHNVSIGASTAIAGCVGIAGSTTIGKHCLIGGGSSIAGHIQITDQVHITATSAVNHSLLVKGVYSSGFPAKPAAIWRKNAARFQFLDDIARRLRRLEQKVQAGDAQLAEDE